MKVIFNCRQLSERGTEVAIFDYARYNEEILGNESVIAYKSASKNNVESIYLKFKNRFNVVPYENFREIDKIAKNTHGEIIYDLKSGTDDGCIGFDIPTAIHAVFPTKPRKMRGTRRAYISEWLSETCSGGLIPFVPHMIDLPPPSGDLRDELGIPKDAIVFGGYGGHDSFDIDFAQNAVRRALERRNDAWFVFMNFDKFVEHQRAVFLPGTANMKRKSSFVDTCNAMIHARSLGESFGIACGEFSSRNRPVITYSKTPHRCHIDILGDAALLYNDENSLVSLFMNLDIHEIRRKNWDRYSKDFAPTPVMAKFGAVFLNGACADFHPLSFVQRLRAQYRTYRTSRRDK